MFVDSSQEVISLTPVPEPFCIPSLMPFELWGDLVGRGRNYVCNSCELRELFLLRLSGGSFPSLNFLTHVPWSTLTWSLRVDPVQISSIFSLCSSLVLCPMYCSHLDLFFWILLNSGRLLGSTWDLASPHHSLGTLSRRWCGAESLSHLFPMSRGPLSFISWCLCLETVVLYILPVVLCFVFQLFGARSKSGACQSLLARSRSLTLFWTPFSQWNYLVNEVLFLPYHFNSIYFTHFLK